MLPMAISFKTSASIAARADGQYLFSTDSFETPRALNASDVSTPRGDWSDYPVGGAA